ncbi:S8/S53 family peptidase [Herbidospora daliensis]|uniref:S8/S53 family peptidase n=1 Tax=Herbidospora daliensis TaxID=295585 RepID=UPI0007851B57|nr:S8/S53 family peptidase [Herbidospora daliensis]
MEPDRFREQFDMIQRSYDEHRVRLVAGPNGTPEYLYRRGVVLIRTADLEYALPVLAEAGLEAERSNDESTRLTTLTFADSSPDERWHDPVVSDVIDLLLAMNIPAERDYLLTIADVNCCPADEPVPVYDDTHNPAIPVTRPVFGAAPVRVLVIDTGLVPGYETHPTLAPVIRKPSNPVGKLDSEIRPMDTQNVLRQYVGHGTFIAGLIAAVAHNVEITVRNCFSNAGAGSQHALGEDLNDILSEFQQLPSSEWPDIISLSSGTPVACDGLTRLHSSEGQSNTPEVQPLLALEEFMNRLAGLKTREGDKKEILLVAAAGNNGSDQRFYPAAWADSTKYGDFVVSVGALRADGTDAACFSNHGRWVSVFAPGERLISTFTQKGVATAYDYQHSTFSECRYHQTYVCTCLSPPHLGELSQNRDFEHWDLATDRRLKRVNFHGLAEWSGTSFSTPLVAAMIANVMSEKQLTSHAAAKHLLNTMAESKPLRGRPAKIVRPPGWRPSMVYPST